MDICADRARLETREQVLGLPGEPRLDKDLPWIKVQRN